MKINGGGGSAFSFFKSRLPELDALEWWEGATYRMLFPRGREHDLDEAIASFNSDGICLYDDKYFEKFKSISAAYEREHPGAEIILRLM